MLSTFIQKQLKDIRKENSLESADALKLTLVNKYRRICEDLIRGDFSRSIYGNRSGFLSQLAAEDVLFLNLRYEAHNLAKAALVDAANGSAIEDLRANLIVSCRMGLLERAAIAPFKHEVVPFESALSLALGDETGFRACFEGISVPLPEDWLGDTSVAVFSDAMLGLEGVVSTAAASEIITRRLAIENSPFSKMNQALTEYLQALLADYATRAQLALEQVISLYRRSQWVMHRMPTNKYIPLFVIGLHRLGLRHLSSPASLEAPDISGWLSWVNAFGSLPTACELAKFPSEIGFLNEMIRDPIPAQRELRARLNRAWSQTAAH